MGNRWNSGSVKTRVRTARSFHKRNEMRISLDLLLILRPEVDSGLTASKRKGSGNRNEGRCSCHAESVPDPDNAVQRTAGPPGKTSVQQ